MTKDNKRIFLSPPHMSGGEMKYIQEAFNQNWIAPLGPNVDAFEEALTKQCGVGHAAVLSSGTAAIHLALILLGVERGDEVIASSFTFSATVNPVVYQGATPVLIDSDPETWDMDPELLERAIKDRLKNGKKPKAIIPVHLYGMPARIDEIMLIAEKYDIPVIEDSAEALGSRYENRQVGSFGKLGVLSFNGNKIITTSGGGALVSNDEGLIQRAKFLSTQARDPAPHYQHSTIGYNYRMSNILAGVGIGQLEFLEYKMKKRREINVWYRELLANVPGVEFLKEPSEKFYSNFWLTCVLFNSEMLGTDREKIRIALEEENIESRPLWKPMHLQPVFSEVPAYLNGNSEKYFSQGLCLPSGSDMSENDMDRIAKCLKKIIRI